MAEKRTLYIIGTPIGNLEDISARAIRILRSVPLILSEDTRVTASLCSAYDIPATRKAVHEHTEDYIVQKIIDASEGDIAYVTDAGMPGISDPGGKVVTIARACGMHIVSIPGSSAVTAALSVCGFPTQVFTMLSFPPHKKGRKAFFESLAHIDHAIVLFESKHRIQKTLAELPQDRYMLLARELTKMHEELLWGMAPDIVRQLTSTKGEFTLVLAPTWYHA